MTFGEYVKKLRCEMNLTQRDLSVKSGISNAEISRLESGERKNPSPKVIKAIAPFLGISYEDLMMQAGYFEHVIDYGEFGGDSQILFDIFRRAKHIAEKDEELIGIFEGIVDKFPPEDIIAMKMILRSFLDDRVPDSDKQMMLSIFAKFAR